MSKRRFWAALGILLIAAVLRFAVPIGRFHPDEALFATFARRAAVNGDWLLHGDLDKPPLALYLQAISMQAIGLRPLPNGVMTLDVRAGEFAARLPSLYASILLVAVMFVLAKKNPWVMLLAACSPFALAFAATSFTDMPMLLGVALAWWMARRGRWGWAGLWLALAIACKPQAAYGLGLLVLTFIEGRRGRIHSARSNNGGRNGRNIFRPYNWRFFLPFLVMVGALLLWDAARWQAVAWWQLAAVNNLAEGGVSWAEKWSRLGEWLHQFGYLFGWPVVTLALIVIAVSKASTRREVLFILAYIAWHVLLGFNVYDRYLLLLLPPVWLWVGRGLARMADTLPGVPTTVTPVGTPDRASATARHLENNPVGRMPTPYLVSLRYGFVMLIVLMAFVPIPVGGDQGRHDGIAELGAYLASKPVATVIYDRWLGWELGYYLGAWSDKRLTYYPTAEALTSAACALVDPAPRYFPVLWDAPAESWLAALRNAGMGVEMVFTNARFMVYQLTPSAGCGG